MASADDTILTLTGIGVPDYSARGLTQTLNPIGQSAQVRRTINGEALDFSYDQFRKFGSTISCQDQQPPAVDGVWPGRVVLVECVHELCYPTGGTPSRAPVSGSERVAGAFTFYRPILNMIVMNYSSQVDEYGATVQWQLELEEI